MKTEFIKQTALDYNIDLYIVERLYDLYYESGKFYDELENIVSIRNK